MEKKLLFSLTLLKVTGDKGFVITTSFKHALKELQRLKAFMIEKTAIINVYNDGYEKISVNSHDLRRIYFGDSLNYQQALNKAKMDKRIVIPEEFLYDKKRYQGQSFIYSAKNRRIMVENSENGAILILKDQVFDILMLGATFYNQFHLDMLSEKEKKRLDSFFWLEENEFALGNGRLTFFGDDSRDFHSVVTEFKNNLVEYSFIRGCDVKYRLDGSIKYFPENDFYIFRDDCRLSPEKALELSPNKKLIKKLIAGGQKDFILDKKYDDIFPAPKNSIFVPVTTIYNKWDF